MECLCVGGVLSPHALSDVTELADSAVRAKHIFLATSAMLVLKGLFRACHDHALAVIGISQSGATVTLLPQEQWACVYLVCVAGMW